MADLTNLGSFRVHSLLAGLHGQAGRRCRPSLPICNVRRGSRQHPPQKYLPWIVGARHLTKQCQPLLVARAIDEPANRLNGEFARRYFAFGREGDEPGSERKVPEREQRLIDHGFVLEGGNDIAE